MNTQALINALIRARESTTALQNSEDGGTCNFDCPFLVMPKGTRESTMNAIGKAAGVWFDKWDNGEWHISGDFLSGQGNRRANIAETFVTCLRKEDSLKNDGIKCYLYCSTD